MKRREPKPFWDKQWLRREYIDEGRSAKDIAVDYGTHENNVLYFLHKYGIPRRSVSEARQRKHWSLSGSRNGMYGRTRETNPNWKGGITAERQAFYASREWARAVQAIWQRDHFTCQRCRKAKKRRGQFHIHHRITFGVTEVRANYQNLVLLCRPCHSWIHSKRNVNQEFIGVFQTILV